MKGVKIQVDKLKTLVRQINSLTGKDVLVGIPEAKAERKDDEHGPMNNATLGYIHEHGSPAANIPARPFLKPGITENKDKLTSALRKAADDALAGKSTDAALQRVGLVAQAGVRAKINSGDFAPLADSTLRARAARGRKGAAAELESRKAGNQPSAEGAKPLVDTGQLRNSINFVVRDK